MNVKDKSAKWIAKKRVEIEMNGGSSYVIGDELHITVLAGGPYPRQREKAIKRAKGRCEICGKPGQEVHHINQERKDNRLENLMLLCRYHHRDVHSKIRKNPDYVPESRIRR